MGIGKPGVHGPHGHLHGKGREEREPEPDLHRRRKVVVQQCYNVGRARHVVHGEYRQQHQNRAEQRVEEELEARINAPLAAPHPDDQKHRDQSALEEEIEQY